MSKKKKKLPPTNETKEGTILLFPEAISEEGYQQIKKFLDDIPCEYTFLVQKECVVHLREVYYGPCQWCGALVYTRDVCSYCGKLADFG